MSFGLAGSTRYSALATFVLALGSSCATSEEPDPDYSGGGAMNSAGAPVTGGVPAAGAPAGGGPDGTGGANQAGATQAGSDSGGAAAGTTSAGAPGAAGKGSSAGAGGAGKAGTGGGAGTVGMGGMAGEPSGGVGSSGMPSGGSGGTGGGDAGAGGQAPASGCDWTGSACMAKSCMSACPPTSMDGGDCSKRCGGLILCLQEALETTDCATAADPMCVNRTNGSPNECTTEWETAGASTTQSGPSKVATEYFECACDVVVR